MTTASEGAYSTVGGVKLQMLADSPVNLIADLQAAWAQVAASSSTSAVFARPVAASTALPAGLAST